MKYEKARPRDLLCLPANTQPHLPVSLAPLSLFAFLQENKLLSSHNLLLSSYCKTKLYFGFKSSYLHPLVTAAQMSAANRFFILILVKSLGLVRAPLPPIPVSHLLECFFCKTLPVMPLSRQGNHAAITQILTIRAIHQKYY